MKKAIFYLTYNGVFDNTNGIGTQTQVFLSGIDEFYQKLKYEFGDFDIHLVTEEYNKNWPGFSEMQLQYANAIVKKYGGDIHFCPYGKTDDEFWTPESWRTVSQSSAATVLSVAKNYSQSLVIANDIPFLQTPLFIEQTKKNTHVDIQSLIALYGSSYIHTKNNIDPKRLSFEIEGLSAAYQYSHVKIGNVGKFMHDHLLARYSVRDSEFVPYRSSLVLNHPDFKPFSDQEAQTILVRNNIPLDKKIIFAFGRATWIKGFDQLLESFNQINDNVILVLNVVPYLNNDPILSEYKRIIGKNKNILLLTGYKRDLPKALSQWPNTKIVVCPSRGEPLSNIPFEVSLWAKEKGPILLCANIEGYKEQIENGDNGFLFQPDLKDELLYKMKQILELSPKISSSIRKNAYNKVMKERDFYKNFREMLACFWK